MSKKIKAKPQSKEEAISKPTITDENIEKEGTEEIKQMYKCSNCGREMGEIYKYCPGCGRPLKKID